MMHFVRTNSVITEIKQLSWVSTQMGDRLVFLFGSLWQIFTCGQSCMKSFIRTGNTHFNGFLNQFEGLYDHFGESQVVAKIRPSIVCFWAQIL